MAAAAPHFVALRQYMETPTTKKNIPACATAEPAIKTDRTGGVAVKVHHKGIAKNGISIKRVSHNSFPWDVVGFRL